MNSTRLSLVCCVAILVPSAVQAVVIENVLVGKAGNALDTEVMVEDGTTGYGAVPYEYRIGKYEVTDAQHTEFLNAVDPTGEPDTAINCEHKLCLYVCQMSTGGSTGVGGGIDFDAAAPNGSKYSVKPEYENFPVTWRRTHDDQENHVLSVAGRAVTRRLGCVRLGSIHEAA